MHGASIPVCEIFKSLEGETTRAGLPCCFIRTAGCNLRCSYCDTRYAVNGESSTLEAGEIVRQVRDMGPKLACLTGGEPLLHAAAPALCTGLIESGLTVLVETNGTLDVRGLPEGAVRILDVKCPGSGECGSLMEENLDALRPFDEVKFVLTDREDFDWAREMAEKHNLLDRCHVLLSPASGHLAPGKAADWLVEWGASARLQLQIHKLLWPHAGRGV